MGIKRIDKSNTSAYINEDEIIEIHYKLVRSYNNNLKVYGVKALWNEGSQGMQITNKEINIIYIIIGYSFLSFFIFSFFSFLFPKTKNLPII